MIRLLLSLAAVIILAFALSSCNNPVNAGYKYAYPESLKADTAYATGEIGLNIEMTASVPNGCWEADRVNLVWLNDTLANISVVCRHDISEICPMATNNIKISYPVIAPYAHTYSFHVFTNPNDTKYSVISVTKNPAK